MLEKKLEQNVNQSICVILHLAANFLLSTYAEPTYKSVSNMIFEKIKSISRICTGPTMTLQEIVHPWYKVLLIWWGSFSTKYDLSPAITTNSTKNLQLISQVHSLSEKYRQIKNCNGLTLNWSMC